MTNFSRFQDFSKKEETRRNNGGNNKFLSLEKLVDGTRCDVKNGKKLRRILRRRKGKQGGVFAVWTDGDRGRGGGEGPSVCMALAPILL